MDHRNQRSLEKKTIAGIIITTCLFLLAAPVWLLFCGFALPPQYGETFLGELKEKYTRLNQLQGKRIVLIGGSGTAFGYDSRLIEEAFPEYQVVNFGMYAGLGIEVMLELSQESIREGDLVILSPEQEAQAQSDYFNPQAMWQALDGNFSMIFRLSRDKIGAMAAQFGYFASDKLRYFVLGTMPQPDGVYCRSAFNAYGDIESDLCSSNQMPMGYDTAMPVFYTPDVLSDRFVQDMNEYAKILQKKGAALWYRFCPVNALAVDGWLPEQPYPQEVHRYYEMLLDKLDFAVIGNPYNSIMDAGWFYDTNFHLNSSGKIVNTVQLIRDIKAMLGDSSMTEDPHVPMPEADFTKDGKAEGRILTAAQYAGNKSVKTITVGADIGQIEDYAFDGCSSLEAIVIENDDPSACRVGQHLLDGTDAFIYVPDYALSNYRVNYFWAVYADRIKPCSAFSFR